MRISKIHKESDKSAPIVDEQGEFIIWSTEKNSPVALVRLDDGAVKSWELKDIRIEPPEKYQTPSSCVKQKLGKRFYVVTSCDGNGSVVINETDIREVLFENIEKLEEGEEIKFMIELKSQNDD